VYSVTKKLQLQFFVTSAFFFVTFMAKKSMEPTLADNFSNRRTSDSL
jgi:hypothetical protein